MSNCSFPMTFELNLLLPISYDWCVDVCTRKASTQISLNKISNLLLTCCQVTQNGCLSPASTRRNSRLCSQRHGYRPVIGQSNFASIHVWSDPEWQGVGSCCAHEGTSRAEANLWLSKCKLGEVSDTNTQMIYAVFHCEMRETELISGW